MSHNVIKHHITSLQVTSKRKLLKGKVHLTNLDERNGLINKKRNGLIIELLISETLTHVTLKIQLKPSHLQFVGLAPLPITIF